MIVMDLEWNQGYNAKGPEDILQLSAVRIPALGGRIEGSFNAYIKPSLYKKFSVGAKKLPDLALSVSSETDFRAAYQDFLSWCGEETVFATWGSQDFGVLERSAAFYGLPAPRMETCIDLQSAFGRTVGVERCLALECAVDYCAIPEAFSFHNALNDVMYTALVSAYIDAEAVRTLEEERAEKKRKKRQRGIRFAELPPDAQTDTLTMQFTKKQHALNNRALRRVACPICGKLHAFGMWYPFDAQTYYSAASCGRHGYILCRLSLEQHKHCWIATRTVLAATETEVEAYRTARGNEPFRAFRTERQRKSRRRKHYAKKSKDAST